LAQLSKLIKDKESN